jgi:hypothetical protein
MGSLRISSTVIFFEMERISYRMFASVNVIVDMDNRSSMILVNFPECDLKADQEALRRAEQLSCSECQGTDPNQATHRNDETNSLWQIGASPHTWREGFSALAIGEPESRTVFKILT